MYELDGDDDIDHTIDPDNFAGGKEIIRKAPKQPSEPEQERTYTSEELSNIWESLVKLIDAGLGMGILLFCFPKVKLADAFFVGLATAYCVPICWCVLAWLNDLFEDDGNILMPALKSLKRSDRRMARKSFFHNMFGF